METIFILLNQEYLIEIIIGLTLCIALYFIIKKYIDKYKIPEFNLEKEIEAYEYEKANRTYNGKTMKERLNAPKYDICKDPIYIKAVAENEALDNITVRLKRHLSLQEYILKRMQESRKNVEQLVASSKIR